MPHHQCPGKNALLFTDSNFFWQKYWSGHYQTIRFYMCTHTGSVEIPADNTENLKLTPSCSLHSNYCICVVFFKTTYSLYFLLPTSALPSKICFMSVQSCHRHLQINVSHSFDLGKFIMRTLQVFHVSAFHTFILPTLFSS